MSLDLYIRHEGEEVYWGNITHNLADMAWAVGLYQCLWRPEEHGIATADQLIEPLLAGIPELLAHRRTLIERFTPRNGWGNFDTLLQFAIQVLAAAQDCPTGRVVVAR